MKVATTIPEVRAWRDERRGDVGLVPTMGALHQGHLSLLSRARAECDRVAASVFVNPAQFGPKEDFERYPRDLERDRRLLAEAGCDLLFAPSASEVYPPGFDTWVEPGAVAAPLEGERRPGHFRGVSTVVLKLLLIVRPDRAYFGRKDAQQLAVIEHLVRDLDVEVAIVPCDIVREPDGLALSSRNAYLNPEQRRAAPVLHRALEAARAAFRAGERGAEALRALMDRTLEAEPLARVDYVSVADPDTLRELDFVEERGLASLAVFFGRTRLIDNVLLGDRDAAFSDRRRPVEERAEVHAHPRTASRARRRSRGSRDRRERQWLTQPPSRKPPSTCRAGTSAWPSRRAKIRR
jgi:pantoate--beta-alanine ligase